MICRISSLPSSRYLSPQRSSPLTAAQTWTTFLSRFKPITVAVPFSELARAKFFTRDSSNHNLRSIVDSVECFRDKKHNLKDHRHDRACVVIRIISERNFRRPPCCFWYVATFFCVVSVNTRCITRDFELFGFLCGQLSIIPFCALLASQVMATEVRNDSAMVSFCRVAFVGDKFEL